MDHKTWITTYFKTNDLTITPLNKGLTNYNVLVQVGDDRFVVRFPKADTAHIVNRDHEAKALALIAKTDLDVETVYFDVQTGIKITRYVPDLVTFNEYTQPDRIERTAFLMRRLHALNTSIGEPFDPIARYHQYRKHVKTPLISDQTAQSVIIRLQHLTPHLTLCHNDWVPGNIGFSSSKDYLLDYEYAGDNDPFFDVMSFITENDITDEERQRFLNAYFEQAPTASEQERLDLYEAFHNLLWCTWAQMMWESRHEAIYHTIAQHKLNAFNQTKK
jgi:thiamine kinase-like enzyme